VTGTLRLACMDSDAPPLFGLVQPDGSRHGYEPAAAALVAAELGVPLQWVILPWGEMIPAVQQGRADAVWCGQGITPEREAQVDFTTPYAIFDESVLVPRGSGWTDAAALRGLRVAAIDGSANLALAKTFDGAVPVPFDPARDDVFGDMLQALRRGEVDAVVDDDVVLAPLADDPELEVGFTVPTRNRWGVGVAKDRPDLRDRLSAALDAVIADGRLAQVWRTWIPGLTFPLAS
jgi:polar amino acid transport system substrate-binding protein